MPLQAPIPKPTRGKEEGVREIKEALSIAKVPYAYESLEAEITELKEITDARYQERNAFKDYAVPAIADLKSRGQHDKADEVKDELHRYTLKALEARDR